MRAPAIAAVIALTLSGCVKYRPQPLDPPRAEQLFRSRSLADPGLRAFLKRPDWPPPRLGLNDLAAAALYFNPDLDVARAQLRTAQAAVLTAKTKPNPILSTGGGYTNSPESPLVFHFDPAFTLITAGKRGWQILAAERAAEAARIQVAETAWRVRSRVRAAWLDYLVAMRSRDALRNEQGARAATLTIVEKRLNVGEASRPDVNLVRTALIAVAVEAQAAETAINESRAALAAAVGLPSLDNIDTQAPVTPPASLPLNDVVKAGLLHRIDIRRSLLEYAAAEANLHLEIANQYPDLQLSPGYGYDEGHHKITFGPAFSIPVFNRNQGPIAQSEARRAEAEARFNALQAQAIGDMEVALARYNGGLAEMAEAQRQLQLIQQTREPAVRLALEAGEEDQLAYSGVRVESAVAVRARLDALRRTEAALGALEDAVQQPLEPGPPLPDPESKP